MSVFRQTISPNRTCQEAGINDHWCACVTRTQLASPNDNPYLHELAAHFAEFVNSNLLSRHLGKCHALKVTRITEVYLIEARTLAQRDFASEPGLIYAIVEHLMTEPNIEIDYEKLMFRVDTEHGGEFEFTLEHEFRLATFESRVIIKPESISRVNKYGNASWCIHDNFPDLREYCACKDAIRLK